MTLRRPREATELDTLLSVEQAAERLGTSPRFVRRLVFERRIAYVKLGRHVRIAARDLDAFIRAGRVEVGQYPTLTRRGPDDGDDREAGPQRPGDLPGALPRPGGWAAVQGVRPQGGRSAIPERDQDGQGPGTWTDPALGRALFRDWLEEWWATTTNLRPKTRDRDELLLRRMALPSFGAAPLAAISQRDVRAWVA